MTLWNIEKHQLKREYELDRPLPKLFGTFIKPPIVITPTVRGYFEGARINDNGLYNIYLDSGDTIRNIDLSTNVKIQDFLALMSGVGTIFINKSLDGYEVPWTDFGDNLVSIGIVQTQRDMYKNRYETFRDMIMVKPDSTEESIRIERKHEEVGRSSKKGLGHPMIWGKREAAERMSPEAEEIMSQFDQSGGGF